MTAMHFLFHLVIFKNIWELLLIMFLWEEYILLRPFLTHGDAGFGQNTVTWLVQILATSQSLNLVFINISAHEVY